MIGHLPARDRAPGSFGWTARNGRTVDRHSESCTSGVGKFRAARPPSHLPYESSFAAPVKGSLPGAPMGALTKSLAAASSGFLTSSNVLERYRTVGNFLQVDAHADRSSAFGHDVAGRAVQITG